jgi:DNA end-binding protein Ku
MARSIWTGSISFGLVSIPVRVYSAIRAHDVRFHQVTKDGSRIHVQRVSDKTGRKVDYDDLKKGYETSKGRFVIFEPDELKQLAPASTKTVDIEDFVPLEEIDPIYFERTYHLAPANDQAARAYALLAAVMEERQRIGIGKVVMRDKQYLAAIRPYGKGLAMSTMLFADEVVPQSDIDAIPDRRATIKPREKQMALEILDSLEAEWKPSRYHDDYEETLRSLIRAKAKGKTIEAPAEPESAKVLDLVEALEASLRSKSRGGTRAKPRRASGARTRGTTRTRSRATRKRSA